MILLTPVCAPQASAVFSEQVLQCCVIEQRFRQQLLQAAVLVFKRLQPAPI
jgi:hypothetical protein